MPLAPPLNSQQQPIAYFASFFDTKFGQGAGDAYTNYANQQIAKDPSITPYQAAQGFLIIIATKGLAAALSEFSNAVGAGAGAAVGGTVAGLSSFANPLAGIADFFGRLGQANTWIRVGEVLLGLVLLAVGLARLTHAVPLATKVATAVGTKGLA